MSRYDRETLISKLEWEGEDAIEWFEPEEVPRDLEEPWRFAKQAHKHHREMMDVLYKELYRDE